MSDISTELLNKYPPDKILSSIYNDAIAAGSRAILLNSPEKGSYNPLKEFLEEKMITADGFRTKYSLTGNDESIRQGVEILKENYFIRQELNAIELTHDVLTPLIKKDREKRRKELALIEERKKARKKALYILLFTFLLAGGIWALAIKKRMDTQKEIVKLEEIVIAKNAELAEIIKDIERKKPKPSPGQPNDPTKPINPAEKEYVDKLLDRIKNDSIQLADLTNRFNDLTLKKKTFEFNINDLLIQLEELKTNKNISDQAYREKIKELENKVTELNIKIDSLQKEIRDLTNRYIDVIKPKPDPDKVDIKPTPPPANVTLQLDLYYSYSKKIKTKVPTDLTIYLIPYKDNDEIVRQSKVYEIRCDESNLKKATNYQTGKYYNGLYVFSSVPKGKYLIKICTYYGGYYTINKDNDGISTMSLDISPPIR
jgi:uncharacterized coiled-coil protein SlyX